MTHPRIIIQYGGEEGGKSTRIIRRALWSDSPGSRQPARALQRRPPRPPLSLSRTTRAEGRGGAVRAARRAEISGGLRSSRSGGRREGGAERGGARSLRRGVDWFDGKGDGVLRRAGSDPGGHRGGDQEGVLRQGAARALPRLEVFAV